MIGCKALTTSQLHQLEIKIRFCSVSQSGFEPSLSGFVPAPTFQKTNLGSSVNAGDDITTTVSTLVSLSGSYSDDGLPATGVPITTQWTRVSGPGNITFGDPTDLNTSVSCDTVGTHVLRLTVDDGEIRTYDEVNLIIPSDPDHAPYFTASLLDGGSATSGDPFTGLNLASVADDPDGGDTLSFSKSSGPDWLIVNSDGSLSGSPTIDDSGLNTFIVRVTDLLGNYGEASLEITVDLAPAHQWLINEFGESANDPQISGDNADPDNDSYSNLLEYALGMNPLKNDAANLVQEMMEAGENADCFMCMTIEKNPNATDVILGVEVTSDIGDPGSWSSNGILIIENSPEVLRVRDTVGGPMRFMRLKVIRQSN